MLNIAVAPPMPSAMVRTAMVVKPGGLHQLAGGVTKILEQRAHERPVRRSWSWRSHPEKGKNQASGSVA